MKPRPRRPNPIADDAHHGVDDDSQPVIVPRIERALVPTSPERIQRLRKHLLEALRALRTMRKPGGGTTPPAEPTGFVARVARTACTLCEGWCCKGGGEHAYLDERTLARLCATTPGLSARSILRLYLRRVPENGHAGSCIFHGQQGCTLEPSQRSDVCNDYFCGGLGTFVTRGDTTTPVRVFAGEGARLRVSPVLKP